MIDIYGSTATEEILKENQDVDASVDTGLVEFPENVELNYSEDADLFAYSEAADPSDQGYYSIPWNGPSSGAYDSAELESFGLDQAQERIELDDTFREEVINEIADMLLELSADPKLSNNQRLYFGEEEVEREIALQIADQELLNVLREEYNHSP